MKRIDFYLILVFLIFFLCATQVFAIHDTRYKAELMDWERIERVINGFDSWLIENDIDPEIFNEIQKNNMSD